jgi:hypothetical protein
MLRSYLEDNLSDPARSVRESVKRGHELDAEE